MPLTTSSLRRAVLPGLACVVLLSGCATNNPCSVNTEYLAARDRPKLQLPEGVTGSERLSAGTTMNIPSAAPDAARLDPAPQCLDQPPPYAAMKKTAAAPSSSAEETVKVWAAAWANGKPDQVAAFYSPQFESQAQGGAAAHIAGVKERVANGGLPDAQLEQLKAVDTASGRKVITFVQHFGDKSYEKELTLVPDPQGWRIVAERTLREF
jgi:hypothetical protein